MERTKMDNIKARAKKIKMILMDVDGTLTDGTILLLPNGDEAKSYSVRDGMGMLMARLAGLNTGIITGKRSSALEHRARLLRVDELHMGILDKLPLFEDIGTRYRLKREEMAYIGDDLGDLAVLKAAGLAACVADAHEEVRKHCHFVSRFPGGRGAVREFIEFILAAQGHLWDRLEEKIANLKG
jgi:3-deoxy-D-manno-octulosonate 8-phosphate phosphatase (KDO 8-P phosphatase)